MREKRLKNRDIYLKRLVGYKDSELIKVITGIRRCGKSCLMQLMITHLIDEGVSEENIIDMNFESMRFDGMDYKGLYKYVSERKTRGRMYLFFDEIQRVPQWEKAVNSFKVDFDCDIYITGSNAYLLSSELSTFLAGRYVEIKLYPLSFREFLEFNGYTVKKVQPAAEDKNKVTDSSGESCNVRALFETYLRFGGMPSISDVGFRQDKAQALLEGIYSAVIMRDVLERGRRKGQKNITDTVLLRKITMFLADNIGNNVSAASAGNTLANEGLVDRGGKGRKPAAQTIQAYIEALTESYIFYGINRFDIKGKGFLRTLGKYYIADIGLRNYLLGFRDGDTGHILENIIYLELLKRGYSTAVGKIGNREIDFIAVKIDEKKYIQVSESIAAPETKKREIEPLLAVRDNYEK